VAPLSFGRIVLKKWGFKVTFITGLCIYACGTLMFWPSAVLTSFPAFLISNFIVGLGLSTLEIAANPFIVLCGPPEYSELRINVAQGIQAVGSVISPILARRVLFKQILNASSLVDVQWTYLGIALFDIILAVVFYYLPLPEAS
jgi:fucose permease